MAIFPVCVAFINYSITASETFYEGQLLSSIQWAVGWIFNARILVARMIQRKHICLFRGNCRNSQRGEIFVHWDWILLFPRGYFFFFINMNIQISLRASRLILQVLKLIIMYSSSDYHISNHKTRTWNHRKSKHLVSHMVINQLSYYIHYLYWMFKKNHFRIGLIHRNQFYFLFLLGTKMFNLKI
jgi:hypothetical protein